MLVRLQRVVGGSAMRSEVIEGELLEWPWPGQQLKLIADSFSGAGNLRWVNTNIVTEAFLLPGPELGVYFHTMSGSKYLLRLPEKNL